MIVIGAVFLVLAGLPVIIVYGFRSQLLDRKKKELREQIRGGGVLHLIEIGDEKPEDGIKGKCAGGKQATLVSSGTVLVSGASTKIAAYRCA